MKWHYYVEAYKRLISQEWKMIPSPICRTFSAILFGFFLAPHVFAAASQEQQPARTTQDYSKESFVVESLRTTISFQSSGAFDSENVERILIQSQAGVQAFGIIHVPYASANANVEIVYVKVTKPDGSVVVTPPGNILDMPAQVAQTAPLYSDLHDKQVPVKGLEIGDVVEYDIKIHCHTPLIPGQFWYAYDFDKSSIVLAEELQINFPRDRAVKVASRETQPVVTQEGNRKIYIWKSSNLDRKAAEDLAKTRSPLHVPPPAVQITSFRSWDEIAQWYQGLQQPESQPTPEVRALAEKLTQGTASETDKTHILYKYVATKIRYIGLDFGIGRYQPHPAADVLENGYGDCKDKHTLLAALLSAVGVRTYPALVNSSREIDPDVPSPGQFDHLITVIPGGSAATWLDTTTEVAPFGMLTLNLRDRNALIANGESAKLVRIPADSPVPTSMDFQIAGKLDSAGTYEAKIEISFRGDFEIPFRAVFRSIGQQRWNDGVQGISAAWGFAGTVTDAAVSSPEATDEPFRVSYTYVRKDFGDWPTKRIVAPLPQNVITTISENKESENVPIELGATGDITMRGKIELPDGLSVEIPTPSKVVYKKDFADYESVYSASGNTFQADRHVVISAQEVPASRRDEYISFQKSINDDASQFIQLVDPKTARNQTHNATRPEAANFYRQAYSAYQTRDFQAAIEFGQRAIEVEPDYLDAYQIVALSLLSKGRQQEAVETWRKYEKLYPKDPSAPAAIGSILLRNNRAGDAVQDLEAAAASFPDNGQIEAELGQAYMRSGSKEKAVPLLKKAAQLDSTPYTLNEVAFELADANIALDDALGYAEKSVEAQENQMHGTSMQNLTNADLQKTWFLGADWDTLGWAHFRLGHLDQAETYLRAAWSLDEDGEMADHLGQLYETSGRKQEAIHAYALAVANSAAGTTLDHAREKVRQLSGSDSLGDAAVRAAREDQSRTVKLPKLVKGRAIAEFLVLFTQGSATPEVKFISGADELRDAAQAISSAKFGVIFPDTKPVKILRRGILACEPLIPTCDFVLFEPKTATSIN